MVPISSQTNSENKFQILSHRFLKKIEKINSEGLNNVFLMFRGVKWISKKTGLNLNYFNFWISKSVLQHRSN